MPTKGAKTKSQRQVGYLLSSGSPLTGAQEQKLRRELHQHKVIVTPNKPKSKKK